jgi:16S rRNA (cytosine1402-N4)-methyltransferase
VGEGYKDTPERGGHGQVGHVPVLLKEAIDFLNIQRGGTYIDATVGLGGHSYEIARRLGAQGRLIGVDKDPAALEKALQKLVFDVRSSVVGETVLGPSSLVIGRDFEQMQAAGDEQADWPEVELVHGSFAGLADDRRLRTDDLSVDGILADLGVSSLQLDDAQRGFSFQAEGPLDMRMNTQSGDTAEQVVNRVDEVTLANLIYEFGEERRSRRIARAIVRSRPIRTTAQLADVVSAAARPMNQAERRIHPATRTFQALRIFVNRELDDLRGLMKIAPQMLRPGGRLVVISFHSLEDRIVKDAMREGAKQGVYRLLTKKPVTASEEEIDRNPRARSAKLRAAEKI